MMIELSPGGNSSTVRMRKFLSRDVVDTPKLEINIPGLSRIFDQSLGKPKRIIWLLTLTICTITCTFCTAYQLTEYFKFPTASKTIVERKDEVQFPPISICMYAQECYKEELIVEIESKCQQKNITNCNVYKISFRQLGINLQNVWDRCKFISVEASVTTHESHKVSNAKCYEITEQHSALGYCATIIHTEKVIYLSVFTLLMISIRSKKTILPHEKFTFFPHSEPELSSFGYEIFTEEMELALVGYHTQFKLREEMYVLQNITGRECYDLTSLKRHFNQESLSSFKSCRLPFLSDNFPECDTFDEFNASFNEFWLIPDNALKKKLGSRRICSRLMFGIATDYMFPVSLNMVNKNETVTVVAVKFADNSRVIVSEYFSYSKIALLSDLFADWGFFLCLSALVFAEIIEFLFDKIYKFFKQRSDFNM